VWGSGQAYTDISRGWFIASPQLLAVNFRAWADELTENSGINNTADPVILNVVFDSNCLQGKNARLGDANQLPINAKGVVKNAFTR